MSVVDIGPWSLAAGYILLVIPFAVILWNRIPIFGEALTAVVRMTVQLILVGLYLQVVFRLNYTWLNAAWLMIMIFVADVSVLRGCRLRIRRLLGPIFGALLLGTIVPLLFFLGPILRLSNIFDAQYLVPLGGMILGNCLRADIVGIRHFYEGIRKSEKAFLHALAQGAELREAIRPFVRDACQAALMPTIATMATVGLVALPGMMTGVILAGADPMAAVKYQIAIMVAIFSGTALTMILAILFTLRSSFTQYGVLDLRIFR